MKIDCPLWGKCCFQSYSCSRGKAQLWSLLQLTTPAGFTFIDINDWGNVGPVRLPARGLGVTVRERLFGVTTAARVAHGCATPALQPPHDNHDPGPHITSEGRLAPRLTRCAGADPCDLICAHPPVGYRRIRRGCVYSRPRSDWGFNR
jgi:hypothetical protein